MTIARVMHLPSLFFPLMLFGTFLSYSDIACADTVLIGTITLPPPTSCGFDCYANTFTVNNLMQDAPLLVQGYTVGGTPNSDAVTIPAGASDVYLSSEGFAPLTIYGQLSGNNFTLSGQEYQASTLDWTSSVFYPYVEGTADIVINATPLIPAVPEPSALSMLGLAVALATLRRKGVRPARLSRT